MLWSSQNLVGSLLSALRTQTFFWDFFAGQEVSHFGFHVLIFILHMFEDFAPVFELVSISIDITIGLGRGMSALQHPLITFSISEVLWILEKSRNFAHASEVAKLNFWYGFWACGKIVRCLQSSLSRCVSPRCTKFRIQLAKWRSPECSQCVSSDCSIKTPEGLVAG